MKRKHAARWWFAMLLGLASLWTQSVSAQNIRGQVVFANGVPFAGANVRICGPQGCSTFAISGMDGMYYLYQIPPGGPYVLEIWVGPGAPRRTLQVMVYMGWTDIYPIAL